MRKLLISILCIVLISSCSKKIPQTIIAPINNLTTLSPKGLIYSLPTTSVRVNVESEFYSYTPGPYTRFAQKYLGISGLPSGPQNYWTITAVKVYTYNHADVKSFFIIEPNPEYSVNYLHLTNQGLIIPAGESMRQTVPQALSTVINPNKESGFVDLSISPYIAAEQTTHYSRVLKDTSYVRVPVTKSMVIEKSVEDKAREAADFIFSLRKRRFDLLSGDADFVASGNAAEAVLKEISRLEAEYLTLFTGKENRSTASHWFDYAPVAQEKEVSTILFRFSAARGVLASSDLSGSPILISVKPESQWLGTEILDNINFDEMGNQRTDAIYYRIPVPVSIRVHDSQTELYSQILPFYQFGPLLRIPSRFMNESSNEIYFPAPEPENKKKR